MAKRCIRETVDHGMVRRSKRRKIEHDIKCFDIPLAYKPMAMQIYAELLRLRNIGPDGIAQIIAEYAASILETCTFCEKFTVFVNEDIEEWIPVQHLLMWHNESHDDVDILSPRIIRAVVQPGCFDNRDQCYFITNVQDHRRHEGGFQVICANCSPGTLCTNCRGPAYDLRCGNCDRTFCASCLPTCYDYSIFLDNEENEKFKTFCYFGVCSSCSSDL